MQSWHIDSPLPNVYVNLLYLDKGPMTEFMVPAALSEMVLSLKPPIKELFSPIGVTKSGNKEKKKEEDEKKEEEETSWRSEPIISDNWKKYLQKR